MAPIGPSRPKPARLPGPGEVHLPTPLGPVDSVALGLPPDFGESKEAARLAHAEAAAAQAESLAAQSDYFDDELRSCVEALCGRSPEETLRLQDSAFRRLSERAEALRDLNASWLASSPPSVASVLRASGPVGMHAALLSECASELSLPDAELITHHLRSGFPLVGDIPADPAAP